MTAQTGKQTTAIHMLLHISRSISSQTMRFGQFIESKERDIFLEKSYTKRAYLIKMHVNVSKCIKNQYSKVFNILFSLYAKLTVIEME